MTTKLNIITKVAFTSYTGNSLNVYVDNECHSIELNNHIIDASIPLHYYRYYDYGGIASYLIGWFKLDTSAKYLNQLTIELFAAAQSLLIGE